MIVEDELGTAADISGRWLAPMRSRFPLASGHIAACLDRLVLTRRSRSIAPLRTRENDLKVAK
jgi:hypothetical protein